MKPILFETPTLYGRRIHCCFLEDNFLKNNIDLGPEYYLYTRDHLISEFINIPENVRAPELNLNQNIKNSDILLEIVDNKIKESLGLKNSQILVYFYTLVEKQNEKFLFVSRAKSRLEKISREDWSRSLSLAERKCCYQNYCKKFSLDENSVNVSRELLDKHCCYPFKHVDISFGIWCYSLNQPFQSKKELKFPDSLGFQVIRDGKVNSFPFISQFAYGSLVNENINSLNLSRERAIYADCTKLYKKLSDKFQFFFFIRDSLNTIYINTKLLDQVYGELGKNTCFSYKLLGCSFYI